VQPDGVSSRLLANGPKRRHDVRALVAFGCETQAFPNAGLEGWRQVKVTDRRAGVDYAQMLKEMSDTHFPRSGKIVLVQDNLSTHKPASLYEAFPAEEARRLVEQFEWLYTPKHGSWLDIAECELSVLSSQFLDRRIPDKERLINEVAAWQNDRNKKHAKPTGSSLPPMPV